MHAPTAYIPPLFAALLVALFTLTASAQNAAQFIAWGDRAMEQGEPYGASRYYGEALQLQPGIMVTQWKYAEACRMSHQYREAADLYELVQSKDVARHYPDALRWLAEMRMSNGQYEEAELAWNKLLRRTKDAVVRQRAEHGLQGCHMAREAIADSSVRIEHLPMPVNGYESEFGGRMGPDSALYFTSLRGDLGSEGEVKDTLTYHARIYRARETPDRWIGPTALPARVNNGVNNANSAWSKDGRWYYFSREEAPGEFSIQALDLRDSTTGSTTVLHVPGKTATQPMVAMVEGEEHLFFTSDMPGGTGGLDLWWGAISGSTLTAVEPIGPPVNTPGNEVTPFYDEAEGILYFSSDFLPGLGGYDLFTSTMTPEGPSPPENLGKPFNSPANDLYPALYAQGGMGLLTSNRRSSFARKGETCCNDLYRFRWQEPSTQDEPLVESPQRIPDTLPHLPQQLDSTALADAWRKFVEAVQQRPIQLYFHNDEPDPRSWQTTTSLSYPGTFHSYEARLAEYDSAWQASPEGAAAFRRFFEEQVRGSFNRLNELIDLVEDMLALGHRVTLTVSGFASPLARSDYNKNLSLRRINSLENYLHEVDGGKLLPYLNGTAANGGRLLLHKEPFGKSRADTTVSDRLDDLQHSVYSVGAAKERRIEIEVE